VAGYAATTRIRRGEVRARALPRLAHRRPAVATPAPELVEVVESIPAGEAPRPTVRERLHDIAVAIDQLTWYLRSPDSWR
jgi:hypothetical protein